MYFEGLSLRCSALFSQAFAAKRNIAWTMLGAPASAANTRLTRLQSLQSTQCNKNRELAIFATYFVLALQHNNAIPEHGIDHNRPIQRMVEDQSISA